MNAKWLIAKYMPDARRREPRNVGVILLVDGAAYMRFRGEDGRGGIDGRRVKLVESLDNYKAWVAYWRKAVARLDPKKLPPHDPSQNYFLEPGGERLLGNKDIEPESFVAQLFRDLVDDEIPVELAMTAQDTTIERAFQRLQIAEKIERDPVFQSDAKDHLSFDFRYKNGLTAWMKRVRLPKDRDTSWEGVHATAWTFLRAKAADQNSRLIALVERPSESLTTEPIDLIRSQGGDIVDVSADDELTTTALAKALDLNN